MTFTSIDSDELTIASISSGQAILNLDAGEYDLKLNVPGYQEFDVIIPPMLTVDGDEEVSYSLSQSLKDVTLLAEVLDAKTGKSVFGADVTGFGHHPEYDPLFSEPTNSDGIAEIVASDTGWEIHIENVDGYEYQVIPTDLTSSAGEVVE